MTTARAMVVALVVGCAAAHAQQPAPPGMSLPEAAARRFPQPVSVGALLGRRVLQPTESQPTVGFVHRLVRRGDGPITAVIEYGGLWGLFSRRIAVPVDAMVLLGPYMEIVDLKPEQLDALPTYDGAGATELPSSEVIRVGLARPSH